MLKLSSREELNSFLASLKPISKEEYNVLQINSIAHKYKHLRQKSKGITFALQYNGTFRTLMTNFKLSESEAIKVEERYHKLYKESFKWAREKIQFAQEQGFIKLAFGLPLITPNIYKYGMDSYEASKEYKTVFNALGQSWGLLNDRARVEFLKLVDEHGLDNSIYPIGAIHDSQYYLIKDDPKVLHWLNEHLVNCVNWQEDEAIKHDSVKLSGKVGIFYPSWAEETEIPNGASIEEVTELLNKAKSIN